MLTGDHRRFSTTRTSLPAIGRTLMLHHPRRPRHRPRPRWTIHPATHGTALTAETASPRAILTLALAARGLIEIINALGHPWAQLLETVLLAALALGCFAAAQHSRQHRNGWLLSSAAATGLAIASCYRLT
jgi:hypothetical protein